LTDASPPIPSNEPCVDRFVRRFAGTNATLLALWTFLQFATPWSPWWLVVLTKFHVYAFLPVPVWMVYAVLKRKRNARLFRTAAGLFVVPTLLWITLYGRLWFPRTNHPLPPDTFKVLTYNLLNSQTNLDRAIGIVERLDPDVVCFQEVIGHHAAELTKKLAPRYPRQLFGAPHPGGTTALFSKSAWLESSEVTMPHGRPAVWASIPSGIGPVEVVSAHLMHYWRGDLRGLGMVPTYVAERTQMQEEQIKALTQRFATDRTPVILAMDGNLVPHSRSWNLLGRRFEDSAFATGWSRLVPGMAGTTPELRPLRLDYLWVRNLHAIETLVVQDSGGSDHHPVLGRFSLPVNPVEHPPQ
jgi:endonuclease/exonuclease/phosphatase (EEP) superfamily protein YafD